MERLRGMQRELAELQTVRLSMAAEDSSQSADTLGGCRVVARSFDDLDVAAVKTLANLLAEHEGVVALLGSTHGGKATVVFARCPGCACSRREPVVPASLSEFGGGGGGRPDFAQGGGVSPERLQELRLAYVVARVRDELEDAS